MASTVKQSVTKLVPLLERLSLVRINQDALDRVTRCIEFSQQIDQIDTNKLANVKPMISPTTDDECIYMRDDSIERTDRIEIIKNAQKLVEDYFVTPNKHKHYSDL
ncbi:hypothetical protein BLA29_002789 [Euroglyphus maynei]|uniref:Glutamyl-tRNA(Gln) amidotransferase subunit C, mitochondrial n=1 Tax=Euroglyphus maynei TaxID=6958 RepID=A0A1Y3BCM9_EURMA|nr:hypothetical protein BLA29_002789 [Euroglyphus maynei]